MTRRHLIRNGLALALAALARPATAQRATERYIPIGRSPGLSGKWTVQGTIAAVDLPTRTLTCAYGPEKTTMKVGERTRIWLDRSLDGQTNLTGSFGDCITGRRMEARYVNDERKPGGEADWIKVEVRGSAK